jgi:hypothetical protein
MGDKDVFTVKDGALFVQRSPSADPEYLGCYDLGDLSAGEGDISLIQAFDVDGNYETLGYTEAAPAPITTTLTTYLSTVAEFLEQVACPFFLHANLRCGGKANVVNNYERAVVLKVAKRTNRTLKGLVMREGDGKAEQEFGLAILPPFIDIYKLTPDRQTTTEAQALNDIFMVSGELCGDCTPRYEKGSLGIATADALAGATAKVRYTIDGGRNWPVAAAAPFAISLNIQPATAFWISSKVIRFMVGRGSTVAGSPAAVAYTDFNVETDTAIGAVWTVANVGAVNAQFFFGQKSLYAYDQFNIWGVAGAGYIYKSEDGGLTWTAQEAGILTTEDFYVIRGAPGSKRILYAAGENNALARTRDGGVTWSAVTGPSVQATDEILTMAVLSERTVFLGYNDGTVYVTYNAGVTWTQVSGWTGSGVGEVRAIEFLNEVQGFMLVNSAAPVGTMLTTRDCGRTWDTLPAVTNLGLNALAVVRNNMVFAVGEPQGGSAVVLKTA